MPFLKIEVHNTFVTGKKLINNLLSVHLLMFCNLGEFYSHQHRLSFFTIQESNKAVHRAYIVLMLQISMEILEIKILARFTHEYKFFFAYLMDMLKQKIM